jgi:hypothetical protein
MGAVLGSNSTLNLCTPGKLVLGRINGSDTGVYSLFTAVVPWVKQKVSISNQSLI